MPVYTGRLSLPQVLATIVAAPLLLCHLPANADQHSSPRISIEIPKNADSVGSMVEVRGALTIDQGSEQPWVLVRPTPTDNELCSFTTEAWYPQDKPVIADEKMRGQRIWEGLATIGQGAKDVGCKYDIIAIVFDAASADGLKIQEAIDKYFRNGEKYKKFVPVSLPPGLLATSAMVTVKKASE